MSEFGEAIIQRVNNPELQKPGNPMNQIINHTVGEWLQDFDDKDFMEQFFLQESTGPYLDLHGRDYGIIRKIDESDEDYRARIIYESMGHLTIEFLKSVYGVKLYTLVDNFDATANTLVSDNPYLASCYGFMGTADDTVKNILNKKFVLGEEITWL